MHYLVIISSFNPIEKVKFNNFNCNLRKLYKNSQFTPKGADWPPSQPKLFVSVAHIHFKGRKTQQEILEDPVRRRKLVRPLPVRSLAYSIRHFELAEVPLRWSGLRRQDLSFGPDLSTPRRQT